MTNKKKPFEVAVRWLLFVQLCVVLGSCAFWRIDPDHFLVRSSVITSVEQEREIVSRATLRKAADGKTSILILRGTAYERGYQQGALLRKEVRDNLLGIYEKAIQVFRAPELFAESYERMRPFIPQEYIDEMHGLAHGSRLPLHVVHAIHALPEMGEWGGKKRIKNVIKQMMAGEIGTSCSNIGASGAATADGSPYAVRILDWGLHKISKLHEYPLVAINIPESGVVSANIGWVGFLGAVSGMNMEGITLGEMGYGDPPNETLAGMPMPFLLREVLTKSHSLTDVRSVLSAAPGTNSFIFLMSDGKTGEAEMYLKDRDRFLVFRPGEEIRDGKEYVKGIEKIVYGGHVNSRMTELLTEHYGQLEPEVFMKFIPEIVMKSNFQNVIYDPSRLRFWVNNAANKWGKAVDQPYLLVDLKEIMNQ